MSLRTQIPYSVLVDEDWETLLTYQEVLDELEGKEKPADGYQALLAQAQKYGG